MKKRNIMLYYGDTGESHLSVKGLRRLGRAS
jgi:hypothetical protein